MGEGGDVCMVGVRYEVGVVVLGGGSGDWREEGGCGVGRGRKRVIFGSVECFPLSYICRDQHGENLTASTKR